ncbi:MAG: hypothetical protein HC853_18265, partial [Anaerolineae bacterium]|nr:hypothetical protein [Anaerolineae bacterium]
MNQRVIQVIDVQPLQARFYAALNGIAGVAARAIHRVVATGLGGAGNPAHLAAED